MHAWPSRGKRLLVPIISKSFSVFSSLSCCTPLKTLAWAAWHFHATWKSWISSSSTDQHYVCTFVEMLHTTFWMLCANRTSVLKIASLFFFVFQISSSLMIKTSLSPVLSFTELSDYWVVGDSFFRDSYYEFSLSKTKQGREAFNIFRLTLCGQYCIPVLQVAPELVLLTSLCLPEYLCFVMSLIFSSTKIKNRNRVLAILTPGATPYELEPRLRPACLSARDLKA